MVLDYYSYNLDLSSPEVSIELKYPGDDWELLVVNIYEASHKLRNNSVQTRLPGAVPQPLFLLLIVFGCIIFFEVVFDFQKN